MFFIVISLEMLVLIVLMFSIYNVYTKNINLSLLQNIGSIHFRKLNKY